MPCCNYRYTSPGYVPWLDHTWLTCHQNIPKGIIRYKSSHILSTKMCEKHSMKYSGSDLRWINYSDKEKGLISWATEATTRKHHINLWSYCSLLQLTEHYILVLLLGNTNSSSLATSCLSVLTSNTETKQKYRHTWFKLCHKKDSTLES